MQDFTRQHPHSIAEAERAAKEKARIGGPAGAGCASNQLSPMSPAEATLQKLERMAMVSSELDSRVGIVADRLFGFAPPDAINESGAQRSPACFFESVESYLHRIIASQQRMEDYLRRLEQGLA